MAQVVLDHLSKEYTGGVQAVRDASLDIADGELLVVLGPSGCGKTTLLRLIAGLEAPTAGTIAIGGRVVNAVPPQDRDVAMVFQGHALYPHLTVFRNLAFGLKMRRYPRDEVRRRVTEAAAALGLTDLLGRRPQTLSGGQRQRVAVGRAIVRRPAVFLFDEPLSNLDARLRVEMRTELKRLHRRLGVTTLYVTHDQAEAVALADRMALLDRGAIQQVAAPRAIYDEPANQFVAGFVGTPQMNFIDGRMEIAGDGLIFTDGRQLRRALPGELAGRFSAYAGRPVRLGIRPEHVHVGGAAGAVSGAHVEARVELVEGLGPEPWAHLAYGERRMVGKADALRPPAPGDVVPVAVDFARAHVFDPATGVNLACCASR